MKLLSALVLSVACAAAPIAPRPPATAAAPAPPDEDMGLRLIARILADACTSEATDAVLIEHTLLLLKACHSVPAVCLRRTCKHLDKDARENEEGFRVAR